MLPRSIFIVAIPIGLTAVLLVTVTCCSFAGNTPVEGNYNLRLSTEFLNHILLDISSDGRSLLFYRGSDIKSRVYNTSTADGPVGDSTEKGRGELTVVDFQSGKDIYKISIPPYPLSARFVPNTNLVFSVMSDGKTSFGTPVIWNVVTNEVRSCSSLGQLSFDAIGFRDGERALGISLRADGGDMLVEMRFTGCELAVIGPVDPNNPTVRTWGNSGLSSDRHSFALTSYGGTQLTIRSVESEKSFNMAPPDSLFFGSEVGFSSDAKTLVTTAASHPFAGEGTKNYVLIYDAPNLKLRSQFEIPFSGEIAIDPRGQLLAIGYTERNQGVVRTSERAVVALYDLASGKKIGQASHLSTAQQNDPFLARINTLAFTPDGRFIFSSTYDTKMWIVDKRPHSN